MKAKWRHGLRAKTGLRQGLQERDGGGRIGPDGVVGIDVDMADDAGAIDDETRRHGQGPGIVAVETGKIHAERGVEFAKIVGEFKDEAKFIGDDVAGVSKKIKTEMILLCHLVEELLALRRNGDESGARGTDLGQALL
jgi:hypothetical protein